EDGIRDKLVTGVQTCALPICVQVRPGGGYPVIPASPNDHLRVAASVGYGFPGYRRGVRLLVQGRGNDRRHSQERLRLSLAVLSRSEERRVGKGCRSWRCASHD